MLSPKKSTCVWRHACVALAHRYWILEGYKHQESYSLHTPRRRRHQSPASPSPGVCCIHIRPGIPCQSTASHHPQLVQSQGASPLSAQSAGTVCGVAARAYSAALDWTTAWHGTAPASDRRRHAWRQHARSVKHPSKYSTSGVHSFWTRHQTRSSLCALIYCIEADALEYA